MACPSPTGQIIAGCDFMQALVDQTPVFDEIIMEDIRPTDGWILNVGTDNVEPGTPIEVTQDRFRSVFPNTTKAWNRAVGNGIGCTGAPCDPIEHQIGWGADRLTWYEEYQNWATPLMCFDQLLTLTHAQEHIAQIINEILKPATIDITSNFLRKRHLLWSKNRWVANANSGQPGTTGAFTYQWTNPLTGLLSGPNQDEEGYFYCSANPNNVFKLTPQALQQRFSPLMRQGYAGKNPYKETSPFIELVSDEDTLWFLDKLGGQFGSGAGDLPNVASNWRFTQWSAANEFWRYGFSGQIGNFMCRYDPMQLRFNFVQDLGASAAPNRYQYQVVLPYVNVVTTGAGGAAGLGSQPNTAYDSAQFCLTQIHHKKGMMLLTRGSKPINPEMPFAHRDFGGKWQFVMDNLGADASGLAISNKRRNKGQFISDFRLFIRPLHYEFMETFFHLREQQCIPTIGVCNASPGYPAQSYDSGMPSCPVPSSFMPLYGTFPGGVPTGGPPPSGTDGPVPSQSPPPAGSVSDQ